VITRLLAVFAVLVAATASAQVPAVRLQENPLLTLKSSPTIGDNINGPSVIKVPDWIPNKLGKYYMYFAHHRGMYIRLAYADSLHGPWKVYEPGVLNVSETAFYRPQPDPEAEIYGVYTHVASPEIYVDEANKRLIMWVHGQFSDGKKWPDDPLEAHAWLQKNGYSQNTQVTVSTDGLRFKSQPAITADPYLRVFEYKGEFYGIVRLGRLVHSSDPLKKFEAGPSPFRDTPYNNQVRHVALFRDGDTLHVFLSVIGAAPEKIVHTTIALKGDWKEWKVGPFDNVLTPEARYECPDWPVRPSEVGEIYGAARQLRDPALYVENGKITLFYTVCGEQGIAGADIELTR
jgi:hypothetical protein